MEDTETKPKYSFRLLQENYNSLIELLNISDKLNETQEQELVSQI